MNKRKNNERDQEYIEQARDSLNKMTSNQIYFVEDLANEGARLTRTHDKNSPLIIGMPYQERDKECTILMVVLNEYFPWRKRKSLAKRILKIPEIKDRISYLVNQADKTIHESYAYGHNLLSRIMNEKDKEEKK